MQTGMNYAVSLLRKIHISSRILWLATAGAAICAGAGAYTFMYANGLSYISNDPIVCANCHVMQQYYDGWIKSTHHAVAVCNDCHTPHDFFGKYMTKGENGFHHSKAFTLQNFNDTMLIRSKNARIVEDNCLRCHADMVGGILGAAGEGHGGPDCVKCHRGVGHGIE